MISPFTASLPPIAHTKIVSTRNIIIMSLLASAYNNPKLLYMQSLLPSFNFFFVTKLTTLKMVMKFLRWYFPNFNHVLKLTISANFITLQVMSVIIGIMLHFFNKLLVKWFGDQRQIRCVLNCMDIVWNSLFWWQTPSVVFTLYFLIHLWQVEHGLNFMTPIASFLF